MEKNKGNPPQLTKKNQDDNFYYSNLFDTTILKKPGNKSEKYKLLNFMLEIKIYIFFLHILFINFD